MTPSKSAYRAWDVHRQGSWLRWWTISVTGIRRAYKSNWLKRLLLTAYLPVLYFAIPFFLLEQAARDPDVWRGFRGFLRAFPQSSRLSDNLPSLASNQPPDIESMRHEVWTFLLLNMQRYPQAFLMVILVGIIAPPLISQDLRTRAYLIYFSRPITRFEYILGKFGVVSFYLFMISAVPALLLYVLGLLLSPSAMVIAVTWDLPLRILASALCLIVPTTLAALALSSLTLESRYASFAWFAIWILGNVTYSTLTAVDGGWRNPDYDPGWRLLTSPYQVLGQAQAAIFGFQSNSTNATQAFLFLMALSIVSLIVLFRRVNAPLRA